MAVHHSTSNPTEAEPKPPSPRQSQPYLGRESEMRPRPDYGEQSLELAPIYVFLASSESSYVTGEVIGATGGRPLG